MVRYTYPHTIENGTGERLTFLRRVPGRTGDRVEIENIVSPAAGPPMHIHHYQEEAGTVREGKIGYQRKGEAPQFAGPGESVVFPPGEAHKFWNAGSVPLRVTGHIDPADNVEWILSALYASIRENGGRPNPFDIAFVAWRYRSEFEMAEIPAALQRVMLPVVVAIGTVLGKYRKYADAPNPVRR